MANVKLEYDHATYRLVEKAQKWAKKNGIAWLFGWERYLLEPKRAPLKGRPNRWIIRLRIGGRVFTEEYYAAW